MHTRSDERRRGMTLVQVLIVVVIGGIVAATVLPELSSAPDQAREEALIEDLHHLRQAIKLYRLQHEGRWPAAGSTDPEVFEQALLRSSDADGTTGAVGTLPYGPYVIGRFPPNPYTGGWRVRTVADLDRARPDDSQETGWLYCPATGHIKANCTGRTRDGRPLESL